MPRLAVLTVILLFCLSSEAAAQRRSFAPTPTQAALTLTIGAKIGGKDYQASGAGQCRHAPDASTRGASASLWMVQYGGPNDGGIRQLNLTLWRLKDGGSDQVSLLMDTRSGSSRVETGGGGEDQGHASVVILPNGPGGLFEISGKDADGKPLKLTIDCPAFSSVAAEGG